MARLQVHISVLDDAGARRLDVEMSEPSRLDVDRDPLYVLVRVEGLVSRALLAVHDQALQLSAAGDQGNGGRR